MADLKVETVRSVSSGTPGRAVSTARGPATLTLDSSTHPQPDALTNSEAFLASVSSCGVTLIELYAGERGIPVRQVTVAIEGARNPAEARFASVRMRFEIAGVGPDEARALVEVYKSR